MGKSITEKLKEFEDHCIVTEQPQVAELVCEARKEIERRDTEIEDANRYFGIALRGERDKTRKLRQANETRRENAEEALKHLGKMRFETDDSDQLRLLRQCGDAMAALRKDTKGIDNQEGG